MTTVYYAVACFRPAHAEEPHVWVACGVYEREGEWWDVLGAGADAIEAYLDLAATLEEDGIPGAALVKYANEDERRVLIETAKAQALMRMGFPVREVPEADEG